MSQTRAGAKDSVVTRTIPHPGFLEPEVLKGYVNKILRVDLTTGSITTEPLPDESVLRKWVGCYGLGLWYLMRELPDGVGPLDPENPLIFLNGPLTATLAASPTNCTITTFNADTHFTAARSHSHGYFGPYLKKAGYDGVIVTGKSDGWVYLSIDDDKVELRDASAYLGKDTHETEDLIKQELGLKTKIGVKGGASVAAIGPAGENVVAGAAIMNDKNHGFCHGGTGRIMGAKRLKAIIVQGSGKVEMANPEKNRAAGKAWNDSAMENWQYYSTPAGPIEWDFELIENSVGLCAYNMQRNSLPGFGKGLASNNYTKVRCYRCVIGCCYDVEILDGPHKGYVASNTGGMENMEGVAMVGAGAGPHGDGDIIYLAHLNDLMGLEGSSVFCAMSVAFEAWEKGMLTEEDTDGLRLEWGDVEVIETLIRRIAHQEGAFAKMLGEGPKAAADRVGLPDAGVHIKGTGMSLHDWRRAWGVLLGQITGTGSGWPAPGADCWHPEPDAGYPERVDRFKKSERGQEVARTGKLKMWHDCNGSCWFASWGRPNIAQMTADAVSGAVGWEFTPEETLEVGHRVMCLERIFNLRHGLTAEDDIDAAPRLTDPLPEDAGEFAGKSIKPYLEGWVRDYYEDLGWDRKTGTPLVSTLKELRIEEYIPLVWD